MKYTTEISFESLEALNGGVDAIKRFAPTLEIVGVMKICAHDDYPSIYVLMLFDARYTGGYSICDSKDSVAFELFEDANGNKHFCEKEN